MIRYIFTKIINKYKLYLCLMIGNISIIMAFSMIMMFRDGSRNKLIQKGFVDHYEAEEGFPARLHRSGTIRHDEWEKLDEGVDIADYLTDTMKGYEDSWDKYLDLPLVSCERIVTYRNIDGEYSYRGKGQMSIMYFEDPLLGPDETMEKHYQIDDGAYLYQDISDQIADGMEIPEDAIPCMVSQHTAESLDLVLGEVVTFRLKTYGEEEKDSGFSVYINGIVSEKENDYFWHRALSEYNFIAIVDKKDFDYIARRFPKDIYYDIYESLDYRYITTDNVDAVDNYIKQFVKLDENFKQTITPIIRDFRENSRAVEQMLYVIILPLIVLVIMFISMIAFRIIDSERGELDTLRNRGLGRLRLIGMYLLQSFLLALFSYPIGLALGYFFGKLVAGVDDFMGFTSTISVKDYHFNIYMLIAAGAAALITIPIMLLPVLLFFRKKKDRAKVMTVPVWEKYFLDVALLVVSIYLLYNYNKQINSLSEGVIKGAGIDPVIFINATLFLFACGILMLRLIFYLVRLINKLGAKKFSPATYAGILQILRTRKASGVISVFLVMTVAMSLFNANMARTINANKQARIEYECGADLRIKEHWELMLRGQIDVSWKYTEPDYGVYKELIEDGTFESATKVIIDDRTVVKSGGKGAQKITMMGISTKEFGETAFLRDGLTDEHWFNYLNELGQNTEGAIISSNLAKMLEVSVGDTIFCSEMPPKIIKKQEAFANMNVKVVGIVDAWPGYEKYYYETDEEGKTEAKENYLMVMNYPSVVSSFGALPYEVWVKTDLSKDEVEQRVTEKLQSNNKRYLENIRSWEEELRKEKSSAIIQITNGIFTADFMLALILCIIGYMIYWITSIRDRELLFGIYRAMGISRGEINRMLVMEQLFLSLMSILAGVLAGTLASRLFVRLFAAVYLPQKHNVDVFVTSYGVDLIRLGAVLFAVIIICVLWIRRIVRGLNITEALKLGDD